MNKLLMAAFSVLLLVSTAQADHPCYDKPAYNQVLSPI